MTDALFDLLIKWFSWIVYSGAYTAAAAAVVLFLRMVFLRFSGGRGRMALWYVLIVCSALSMSLCIPGRSTVSWYLRDGVVLPPLRAELTRFAEIISDGMVKPGSGSVIRIMWLTRCIAEADGSTVLMAASIGWLIGAVGFALAYALPYIRLRRRIRALPECNDEAVLSLVRAEKGWRGLSRSVSIKIAHRSDLTHMTCPFTAGVRKPVLVLFAEQWETMTDGEKEAIVAHELMHIRRQDGLLVMILALWHSLQWYNILLWPALRYLRRDLEYLRDVQIAEELSAE